MHIHFTNHAQVGMMERGISTSRVTETLKHPDARFPAREGAIAYEKAFGARTLRVIFWRRGKAEYVIITAYYL